jgi:hypothetical protein
MKKYRILFFILHFSLFILPAFSQVKYSGFSGGMMVHTGWLYGGSITTTGGTGPYTRSLAGAPVGLGGVARIHFGRHLRVGGEGYVSTLNYGGKGNDSHARIGWGGLLVDCMWQRGRWTPYVGGTVGGGSIKNLTLRNPTPLDREVEVDASFRQYGFMLVAPFAGVEMALTEKIRLNAKVDWVVNLTNRQADFPTGPRFYIGISFWRLN